MTRAIPLILALFISGCAHGDYYRAVEAINKHSITTAAQERKQLREAAGEANTDAAKIAIGYQLAQSERPALIVPKAPADPYEGIALIVREGVKGFLGWVIGETAQKGFEGAGGNDSSVTTTTTINETTEVTGTE